MLYHRLSSNWLAAFLWIIPQRRGGKRRTCVKTLTSRETWRTINDSDGQKKTMRVRPEMPQWRAHRNNEICSFSTLHESWETAVLVGCIQREKETFQEFKDNLSASSANWIDWSWCTEANLYISTHFRRSAFLLPTHSLPHSDKPGWPYTTAAFPILTEQ